MYERINNIIIEGDYKKAIKLIKQSLDKSPGLHNKIYLINAIIYCYLRLYEIEEAAVYAEKLIQLEKETKDISDKASIFHMYGVTRFKSGDMIRAYASLRKALQYARQAKNQRIEVKILDSLGRYYEDDGEVVNSIYFYKMSERQKILLKDNLGLAITYGNLGRIYYQAGDMYKAKEYFQLNYSISKTLGDYYGQAIMLNFMGDVYRSLGLFIKADKLYKESLKIAEMMKYKLSGAFSMLGLGHVALDKGEIEEALDYSEKARKIFKEFDKYDGKIHALLLLSEIYIRKKDLDKAEEYIARANALSDKARVNFEMSQSLFHSAKLYFKENKFDFGLKEVEKYFQIMLKLSRNEVTIYRNIIMLLREITDADDVILLLKRDRALEMIKINPGVRNFFKVTREIISSWEELNDRVKNAGEYTLSRDMVNWLTENNIVTSKYVIAARLNREGETIGFIVANNEHSFKRNGEELINILNAFSDKISDVIWTLLSIELSKFDALTRLKNRETLFRDIKDEIYKAVVFNKIFALFMIDIDDFKDINDNYGHQLGDFALVNIANLLRREVREIDSIYRYGGDEFLILISDISEKNAINFVERFLNRIRKQNIVYKLSGLKITVSVGGYIFNGSKFTGNPDNVDPKVIIKNADKALYKAKYAGKDRYKIYDEE